MTSAIYQELSERAAVIYEKVVMWRRDFHRSHEHRRMRVVTARVHDARNLGCIGKTRLLL